MTSIIVTDYDNDNEDAVTVVDLRRRRMREFYQMSHALLSRQECLILYKVLKDYRRHKDLRRLIVGVNLVLRTYNKLELLKYVRYFLWDGHIREFDRVTQFHRKFRRRRHKDTSADLSADFDFLQFPVPTDRGGHSPTGSVSTRRSGTRQFRDVRVFTLTRDKSEPSLGFSVRGGSEHGLSIYISEIDQESAAEKCGLEVGDKILEVNNISLRGIVSSTAVKLLTGSNKLKLVVERTRKVPEWRLSREKTSWYDVHKRRLIRGEFEECGISHHIRGLDVDVPERRVNVNISRSQKTLGFNIRGGREYGVGIYVSRVDRGGLADSSGVHVGDQIIDVNGVPFDNITHAHAVEVMRGKKHLILTLRDVGRFPVYKEMYAEYTWSDGRLQPGASCSTASLQDIQVMHTEPRNRSVSVTDLFNNTSKFPSALQTEIFLPNQRSPSTGMREKPNRKSGKFETDDRDSNDEIDDNESLIDLDQWAEDIQASSDRKIGSRDVTSGKPDQHVIPDVTVHATEAEGVQSQSYILHQASSSAQSEPGSSIDMRYANDDPDMTYAKINKLQQSHDRTGAKMVADDNVRLSKRSSRRSSGASSLDISRMIDDVSDVRQGGSSTGSHLSVSADNVSATNVDGALYSQVRRLSGSMSPFGSSYSLKDLGRYDKSGSTTDQFVLESRDDNKLLFADNRGCTEFNEDDNNSSIYCTADGIRGRNVAGTSDPVEEGQLDIGQLEERLHELQMRQAQLGTQELDAVTSPLEAGSLRGTGAGSLRDAEAESLRGTVSKKKKGKWSSFKNKIKGSLRLKSPKRVTIVQIEDKDVSKAPRGGGRKSAIDPIHMARLEESARKLLAEDEFNAVFRHIRTYHHECDVDRLVEVLVVILDSPEKLVLLKDIRSVIYTSDTWHYDNLVNRYEIDAYQRLSMKLHLPLHHRHDEKPRRSLITTEIDPESVPAPEPVPSDSPGEAENGHFHIKSVEKSEKEREVVDAMRESVRRHKGDALRRNSSRKSDEHAQEETSALDQFEYLDQEHSEEGSSIVAFSDYSSRVSSDVERTPGSVVVHLSKNKQSIGIDLEESTVDGRREVRITRVHGNGAAHDDSTLEVGMAILAVDRHRVSGMSRDEVLAVMEQSYMDKQHVSMKLVLHREESTHF